MRHLRPTAIAAMALLLSSGALAVPIATTPTGDANGSGTITSADLQCLLRLVTALSEYRGSAGVLRSCDSAPCAVGSCREAPGGGKFCAPACLAPGALLEKGAGCVDAPGVCAQGIPASLMDLDCDDRLGSGDLDALSRLILSRPGDYDGDGVLDLCDPDTDGDGAPDGADCAPFDETVYPGAPELCDGRFNGCPPGGPVDYPPNREDPNCAALYGPIVDALGPDPLSAGVEFIVVGAFFVPGETTVTLGDQQIVALATSTTQLSAVVPPDMEEGLYTLTLTTTDGVASFPVIVAGAPSVTGVYPEVAVAGEPFSLTGDSLIGAQVQVCGYSAQILGGSGDTVLDILVNPFTPTGECDMVVSTPAGSTTFTVTVVAGPPYVTGLVPNPVLSGEPVIILGANLTDATVTLNGQQLETWVDAEGNLRARVPELAVTGLYTLTIETSAGDDTAVVFVTDTVLGPPILTQVKPDPIVAGEPFVLKGDWLDGATLTLGSTPLAVDVAGNTEIQATLPANLPAGSATIYAVTPMGVGSLAVNVIGRPKITSASPLTVGTGGVVTINGAYLFPFTHVTLGGVEQTFFSQLTASKLVLTVSPATPVGAQTLVIETPSGTVSIGLTVTPGNPSPPEIVDVDPPSAVAGDIITLTGSGLAGCTFTIGGVAHPALNPGNDLVVKLQLSGEAPPGEQVLRADKGGFGAAEVPFYVIIGPPRVEQIHVSAVGPQGQVALVFAPGALAPLADVDIGTPAGFLSVTAAADGSAGVVLENMEAGDLLSLAQGLPGNVSVPVDFPLPVDGAALSAPNASLTRVELRGDGVEVFGPAPAFGSEGLVLVVVGQAGAVATVESLHGDPSQGLHLVQAGANEATLFVQGDSGSSVPETLPALVYDPPLLASAPVAGELCLVGFAGASASAPAATLAAWHPGDITAVVSEPVVTHGADDGFVATATAEPPAVVAARWSVVAQEGTAELNYGSTTASLGTPTVSAGAVASATQVDADGLADGQWLVVASASGRTAVGVAAGGSASVVLAESGATGRAFVYDPVTDRASECVGF